MNNGKNSILKALYNFFEDQEKKIHTSGGPTPLGQTLTVVELTNKTKLTADEIQKLCYALMSAGHIILYQKDIDNKSHRYLITDSGRQAYIDKYYLNRIWYRNLDFWLKAIPIIIAAGGLLYTISINNKLKKTVAEQNTNIINLKTHIESLETNKK